LTVGIIHTRTITRRPGGGGGGGGDGGDNNEVMLFMHYRAQRIILKKEIVKICSGARFWVVCTSILSQTAESPLLFSYFHNHLCMSLEVV
jgi:hypothetical protein